MPKLVTVCSFVLKSNNRNFGPFLHYFFTILSFSWEGRLYGRGGSDWGLTDRIL